MINPPIVYSSEIYFAANVHPSMLRSQYANAFKNIFQLESKDRSELKLQNETSLKLIT